MLLAVVDVMYEPFPNGVLSVMAIATAFASV
jgi:hypothetical protein